MKLKLTIGDCIASLPHRGKGSVAKNARCFYCSVGATLMPRRGNISCSVGAMHFSELYALAKEKNAFLIVFIPLP